VVIILVLTYLCLLAKDTVPIGDAYILRGISQLLALAGGFLLFLRSGGRMRLGKYFVLVLYFVSVAISSVLSDEKLYSSLQVISLGAILFFFVTYLESPGDKGSKSIALENTVVWAGTAVCVLSLVAAKLAPSVAYMFTPWMGGVYRFRGIFGQPAMLAPNAGIVSGIVLFSRRKWPIKVLLAFPALACLVLSGARTFWVGWVVAAVCAVWWTNRKSRLKILTLGGFALVVGLLVVSAVRVNSGGMHNRLNELVRMESVGDVGGRMSAWRAMLHDFGDHPFFGYGFSVGDEELSGSRGARSAVASSSTTGTRQARYTLHNGYLQALLDSGVFGLIFYLLVISKSQIALLFGSRKRYATVLFVVIFMAVADLAESVMFTAGTEYSVLGWFYVVFALSLAGRKVRPLAQQVAAGRSTGPVREAAVPQ
jgi:O-antigen ligase